MNLLCRLGVHQWNYGKRFEDADGVTRSWCTRCKCRMMRDERRRWRAVKEIAPGEDPSASICLVPTPATADPPIEEAATVMEEAVQVEAPQSSPAKFTPEERAARTAAREKKLAAISPKGG